MFDGFVCNNTVTVRKILWHAPSGGSISGQPLYLWQWDDDLIDPMTDDERWNYFTDDANAVAIPFEPKDNPASHWTAPYVIPKNGGHKFYGRWGYGHDFEGVTLERNNALWGADDGWIQFIMPFYAIREAIYFDDSSSDRHVNNSYFNSD